MKKQKLKKIAKLLISFSLVFAATIKEYDLNLFSFLFKTEGKQLEYCIPLQPTGTKAASKSFAGASS